MPRPRSFSQQDVLRSAMRCFVDTGYEGTSIDDLVQALALHRGSLYKAFGSKRGLFLAVLDEYVRCTLPDVLGAGRDPVDVTVDRLTAGSDLDLLLVAAVERGHTDVQVSMLVGQALAQLDDFAAAAGDVPGADLGRGATGLLATRLRRRLLDPATSCTTPAERGTEGI